MTIFRLGFAGQIKKVEMKQAGSKQLADISICKKNRTKPDEEASFTWVRISLWEPAEFQVCKLVKGAFIAGSGDFHLRSYTDKHGAKAVSAEVRCSSFDVEVGDDMVVVEASKPMPGPGPSAPRQAVPVADPDEPPFAPRGEF